MSGLFSPLGGFGGSAGLVLALAGLLLLPFLLLGLGKRVSGRAVLAAFVGLFGVIIFVNIMLAYRAVHSFPGVEVANSYVASQEFDEMRAAQLALGWNVTDHGYRDGHLVLEITDRTGQPAPVDQLEVTVGRTTTTRFDLDPDFTFDGHRFVAPLDLEPGNWLIHLTARAPDGTLFRQRFDFHVRG